MELCPKNIWVEDEFQVYLRPFKLKIENSTSEKPHKSHNGLSQVRTNSKYWYYSPEYTLQTFKIIEGDYFNESVDSLDSSIDKGFDKFGNDMWSLGCIFAEMFASQTPLFQTVNPFERVISFFEVRVFI